MTSLFQKIKDWLNPSSSLINVASSNTIGQLPATSVNSTPKGSVDEPVDIKEVLLRKVKLIMVTAENNNKFYEMEELSDGNFTVKYGRVGGKDNKLTYPISEWDAKYKEKVKKGYTDQTYLFAENTQETDISSIKEIVVKNAIENLIRYANSSILKNYVVSASQVTRKQVDQAQGIIDYLAKMAAKKYQLDEINSKLLELYKVIPRKMVKVNDHLITPNDTKQQINDRLGNEQETLDVMRSQVEISEKQQERKAEGQTIDFLENLGLSVSEVQDARVIKLIKLMMGSNQNRFETAFEVINHRTQILFDKHKNVSSNKKSQLFWHGSRNENWLSIMQTGLVLRPANAVITGKMFGYGIYFANEFKKSLNYTSLNGSVWAKGKDKKAYLAIYEVHTGNQLEISKHETWCASLDLASLKKKGPFDSVYAKKGVSLQNNEYIIYQQSQCTIKYLVEVTQ